MASRTAVSAWPWHQCSAALEALDVDRRAGVAAASGLGRGAENTRAGSRSALALRHSGTRKRRYRRSSLRAAGRGLAAQPPERRAEPVAQAGVLRAVWNAGDEPADATSALFAPPTSRAAMPLGSRGRRPSSAKTSPALASSGEQGGPRSRSRPPSSGVHRIENSSSGSMSMKDAVELLNDSPRPAWTSRRRSKDDGALHLGGHPPRERLSLRDGEASMEKSEQVKLLFV